MNLTVFVKTVFAATLAFYAMVLAIFALTAPKSAVAGVAVGGALGMANLVVISWICRRLVTAIHRWRYVVAMTVKFAGLVAAVWAAVTWIPMDIMGFVAGLSCAVLAVVVVTTYVAVRKLELEL